MKKILGLTIAALLVMGLVGGGTWAYFSDPETITGNYLSAGTLDLDVDGTDDPSAVFQLTDVYPGENSSDYAVLLNSGSIAGELDISITGLTNTENLTSNTEFQALGGAVLGASTNMSLWLDIDDDGVREATDWGLNTGGSTYDPSTLQWAPIDNYDSVSWSPAIVTMAASDQYRFYVEWKIDPAIGNEIQADVCTFTINFTLEQAGVD